MLGFLAVATLKRPCTWYLVTCFNPVLGFLAVATLSSKNVPIPNPSFNPVLGFLAVATFESLDEQRDRDRIERRVSIPCWVFWPSRQDNTVIGRSGHSSFNPVLGFLAVATISGERLLVVQLDVSIPCWVFWPSRPYLRP